MFTIELVSVLMEFLQYGEEDRHWISDQIGISENDSAVQKMEWYDREYVCWGGRLAVLDRVVRQVTREILLVRRSGEEHFK